MRSSSLTRKTSRRNGRLANTYNYDGKQVDVCDSARNAILIIELFQDEELQPDEKEQLLFRMLFPDPREVIEQFGDALEEMLIHVMWEAFGLDISPDKRHADESEPPVFDFNEDAARIRASLLQCFGIDWDKVSSDITYSDMCALLGMLLEAETETPFQQAVYYRTAKPPKRNKHNREICDAFEARRDHFALKDSGKPYVTSNDKAADMFAAMKRAAQRGA